MLKGTRNCTNQPVDAENVYGVALTLDGRYGYFMASFLAFFYSHQWEQQQHCGSQIAFFAGGPSHAILFRTIVMGVVISTRQLQPRREA